MYFLYSPDAYNGVYGSTREEINDMTVTETRPTPKQKHRKKWDENYTEKEQEQETYA